MADIRTRTTPARRRTQEERRALTRAKLLDATLQSVLDVGYHATTTRRVAELAGVSQGAQTHHFPRRVDLVGAAVERLAEKRIDELLEMAAHLPQRPPERLAALLDLIWTDFSSSTFTVFVKLWLAAADDPELYERLVPVERQIARAITSVALNLQGDLLLESWEAKLSLALAALRGLALTERFEPRGRRRRRDPWPEVRQALLAAFDLS
jgi:AcrR family transcriptional regulator